MPRVRGLSLLRRVGGQIWPEKPLHLHVKNEHAVFGPSVSISALTRRIRPPAPGVMALTTPANRIDEEDLKRRVLGRTSGGTRPPWHDGSGGALMASVFIGRVRDARHMPEYGAVITSVGAVIEATVGEALFLTPDLAALPGVTIAAGVPQLRVPPDSKVISRAAVFMPWGARFNYGHFLIDALSSLAALDEQGLLDRWTPITPPLTEWQREGLSLFLGDRRAAKAKEMSQPILRVKDLVFATPMNHFLHAPNKPLDLVRRRMSDAVPRGSPGPARLYINRRADSKRSIVNEPEVEAALARHGFVSVAPETLPLSEQIALFRDADAVVAPSGAALANVLFCKPGAKIFEIQPLNAQGIWVRQIAHFVGADWYGFFTSAALSETAVRIDSMDRPLILFSWEVPTSDVVDWIVEGLKTPSP